MSLCMYMWYVTMLCVRMYVHVVCVYVVKFYKIIIVNCIKWDKRKQTSSVIDVQEHRKKNTESGLQLVQDATKY